MANTTYQVKDHITADLLAKYPFDPCNLRNGAFPLAIGINLHIVAGEPPKLIVNRRASNLASFPGFYAATIQGWCEYRKDQKRIWRHAGDQTKLASITLNYIQTMVREAREEREQRFDLQRFHDRVVLMALTYDPREYCYAIIGYLRMRYAIPESIQDMISEAKESTHYELVPFPKDDNARKYRGTKSPQ